MRRAPAAQRKHHDTGKVFLLVRASTRAPGQGALRMSVIGAQRSGLWDGAVPAPAGERLDSFWRSLFYFNVYRLFVALLLLMTMAVWGAHLWFGSRDPTLFAVANIVYLVFSVASFVFISARWRFN